MSSPTNGRTKRPDTRRSELLDAAANLFQEQGVADVTVADIAKSAGAAKGTFYLYFPTKDALVGALREELAVELAEAMALAASKARGEGTGFVGEVLAELNAVIDFGRRQPKRHDVLFHFSADGQRRVVVGPLAHTIEVGCDEGQLVTTDPSVTAYLLYAAVHGAVDGELHRPRPQWSRLRKAAEELTTRALQPVGHR